MNYPANDSPDQKWPNRLVIVRHGQSQRNEAKDLAKQSGHSSFGSGLRDVDTPLTEKGGRRAELTGQALRRLYEFDVAFTSPYERTRCTTNLLLRAFEPKPKVVVEERIREIEFGILDGLTSDGIVAQYPREFIRRNTEGKYWYRPPGGENRLDVALRVHSFLDTLTRDYRKQSVLVVGHSVVVLIFRRLLERWDEAVFLKVDAEDDVRNCSVTAYRFNSETRKLELERYNEISYPSDAPK